jgi:hypothetical protein
MMSFAKNLDSGSEDCSVEAAISKVFAGGAFIRACPDAQFEGTNEVSRLYIALSALNIFGPCRNFSVGRRVLAHGQQHSPSRAE